ncbi:MAG: hypothetical protein ACKO0Y_10355, partial [Bacteroidota bacterium]
LAEVGLISRDSEVACMRSTLGRMESDLDSARRRAEAWAVGASLISEKGRKLELQASIYDESKVKTATGTALFIKREQVNP